MAPSLTELFKLLIAGENLSLDEIPISMLATFMSEDVYKQLHDDYRRGVMLFVEKCMTGKPKQDDNLRDTLDFLQWQHAQYQSVWYFGHEHAPYPIQLELVTVPHGNASLPVRAYEKIFCSQNRFGPVEAADA